MDAVEFPYPVNIAVPTKLMGSEGLGGARVTVKEVDDDCEPKQVSILVNSSIERCSTSIKQKGATSSVSASKSASWHKIPEAERCRLPHQLASFHGEDSSEQLNSRGANCLLVNSRPESAKLQRKAGKVSRSSSGHSKRLKVSHLEDTISSAGVDDIKDISNKQGSYHTKCNSPDKTQLVKQKNNCTGKRGDKRNFKVPVKMASFNLAAGFGLYGLKSDINDVTKLLDDLSVNKLLDGTYECPILSKEKEKKVENMNENLLNSVRKVCSILPLLRPLQSQNFAEADSCSSKKFSQFLTSSVSMVTSGDNSDKGDSCATDLSSSNKDCCNKPETETAATLLDFPLCQPKDILERLALPPPKDLESLLQDAAKPSQYSRNTSDLRSGKQIARRVSLPPFPWSHAFSGHCRTNSDAVKFPTSRSTCQGRWVRIGNIASSHGGIATDSFTNLDSLTYDQSLVPSGGPKLGILDNKISPSIYGSLSWCEWDSSSLAAFSKASHVSIESRVELKDEENAGHSPRLLAAAQTLYDIATQSLLQNPDGIFRWPKKPSQKVMKARKLKSVEKPEEIYATSTSGLGSDNQVRRGAEQIMRSKRPKVSTIENKRDLSHTDPVRKGSINWYRPRSSRSSLISVRGSIAERRNSSANTAKQSCMMPPPARVSDKACSSQQKLRKLMPMDWDRRE